MKQSELFEKYLRKELTRAEKKKLKELLEKNEKAGREFTEFIKEYTLTGSVLHQLELLHKEEGVHEKDTDHAESYSLTPSFAVRFSAGVASLFRRPIGKALLAGSVAFAFLFITTFIFYDYHLNALKFSYKTLTSVHADETSDAAAKIVKLEVIHEIARSDPEAHTLINLEHAEHILNRSHSAKKETDAAFLVMNVIRSREERQNIIERFVTKVISGITEQTGKIRIALLSRNNVLAGKAYNTDTGLLSAGIANEEAGRYYKAKKEYRKSLNAMKKNGSPEIRSELLLRLGYCSLRTGDPASAKKYFSFVKKYYPEYPLSEAARKLIAYSKDAQKALNNIEKIEKKLEIKDPGKRPVLYSRLSSERLKALDIEEAEHICRESVRVMDTQLQTEKARFKEAWCYKELGKLDKAEDTFNRISDPFMLPAVKGEKALIMQEKGSYKKAADLYRDIALDAERIYTGEREASTRKEIASTCLMLEGFTRMYAMKEKSAEIVKEGTEYTERKEKEEEEEEEDKKKETPVMVIQEELPDGPVEAGVITSTAGSVFIIGPEMERKECRGGDILHQGDSIEITGDSGEALFTFDRRDLYILTMPEKISEKKEQLHLKITDMNEITLDKGKLTVKRDNLLSEQTVVIHTPHAKLLFMRTLCVISVGSEATFIEVASGSVRLASKIDGRKVIVSKDQYAVAGRSETLRVKPLEEK
ncbi:tetratricopeptide repeat protein [Spirochaetota bacterium]